MSEKDIEEGKAVIASAGAIIWRRDCCGKIKILAGRRKNEPWAGYLMVVFGGLVDPKDANTEDAALREAAEETGVKFKRGEALLIGQYGPTAFHRKLAVGENGRIISHPTPYDISDKYKFVMTVYAVEHTKGRPKKNAEVDSFFFVDPVGLARNRIDLAFDQALALEDFCSKFKITATE